MSNNLVMCGVSNEVVDQFHSSLCPDCRNVKEPEKQGKCGYDYTHTKESKINKTWRLYVEYLEKNVAIDKYQLNDILRILVSDIKDITFEEREMRYNCENLFGKRYLYK